MTANLQLFLDLFIKSNKERFKDNAAVVAMLDVLTLKDIVWDKIEEDSSIGIGGRIATFHSDVHNFVARDQAWICADLYDPAVLVMDDIKASLDEVKETNAPGLYLYIDGDDDKLAAIVGEGALSDNSALTAVAALVKSAAKYELADDAFTLDANLLTVSSECILGSVALYEVQTAPTEPGPGEGGETDPGTGEETDPGTGGGTGEGEGEGGGTPTEPEVDPNEPVITPEMIAEDKALADPTAGGVYSDVGDKGFGVLTVPREISEDTANITAITGMTFGLVGAGSLAVETLNENA